MKNQWVLLFMYAIFQIGNRQYRVLRGQIIHIERINIDIGKQFELNQVLFVKNHDSVQIGNPFVYKGYIVAKVLDHFLDKKIEIVKFRRRKHFRKFQGHRQYLTKISIVMINS